MAIPDNIWRELGLPEDPPEAEVEFRLGAVPLGKIRAKREASMSLVLVSMNVLMQGDSVTIDFPNKQIVLDEYEASNKTIRQRP